MRIAERDGEMCAALRLVEEQGVLLLRGMRVADGLRRQGIGKRLLLFTSQVIGERECYCIPLKHLIGFYAQIGFEEIDPRQAPAFLQDRLREYQGNLGLDAALMRKAPG